MLAACSSQPLQKDVKKDVVQPLPSPSSSTPATGDIKPDIEIMRENQKKPLPKPPAPGQPALSPANE